MAGGKGGNWNPANSALGVDLTKSYNASGDPYNLMADFSDTLKGAGTAAYQGARQLYSNSQTPTDTSSGMSAPPNTSPLTVGVLATRVAPGSATYNALNPQAQQQIQQYDQGQASQAAQTAANQQQFAQANGFEDALRNAQLAVQQGQGNQA